MQLRYEPCVPRSLALLQMILTTVWAINSKLDDSDDNDDDDDNGCESRNSRRPLGGGECGKRGRVVNGKS